MQEDTLRLSKLMTQRNICSRREADRYIKAGWVRVDGELICTLGTKVSPTAEIQLSELAQKKQDSKVTILLNKPVGYVSTQPEKNYKAAIELITPENQYRKNKEISFSKEHLKKLSVAGRLDIDSKGLLVLTQDGLIAKQIIGENSSVEKEYLVRVQGDIDEGILNHLRYGLSLDSKALKRAVVEELQPQLLRFVLREGKKRQIRRMCELAGLKVVNLKRVRVGCVTLSELPIGKWRYMSAEELELGFLN
jgi:23S rRNA pseudouridine2604 synthase